MLKTSYQPKLSPYLDLYDILVPENHILRRFNEMIDFSFVREELAHTYCSVDGRNACDPIMLFKYLVLKAMYPAADRDLVARSHTDLAYKYFLGLNPEDEVIHSSLLTVFRKQHLKDSQLLDLLLQKTVEVAIDKGVLKSQTIIMDATHTASRYNKKSAIELLRNYSKSLRKNIYQLHPEAKKQFPSKNQTYDYQAEKEYVEELLKEINAHPTWTQTPAVIEAKNLLEETVEDCKEYEVYSTDTSAKVGHKTKDTEFFGYKTHIAMTDERIITAAVVTSGEVGDGAYLPTLVEKSKQNGISVTGVVGDTAYSEKDNLIYTKRKNIQLFSKLHPIISNGTRSPEDTWTFNKDAGMFVCPEGHMAIRKARQGKKDVGKNQVLTYYFDVKKCKECPVKENCYKEGAKTKTYSVSIQSDAHKEQQAFQETEEFKEKYRVRYMIEGKNSEIKNKHGYDVSHANDITGMMLQGATTLFVANLKRIIVLMAKKEED